jgi:hypothetical protein
LLAILISKLDGGYIQIHIGPLPLGKKPFLSTGEEVGPKAGLNTVLKLTMATVLYLSQKMLTIPHRSYSNYKMKKKN